MNRRIVWIDYAKVLGMFLVVWGHTMLQPPGQEVKMWIYAFHMPLFFLLSGFLFKMPVGGGKNLYKITKQLIVPLLFFNVLPLIGRLVNITEVGAWETLKEMGRELYVGFRDCDPPIGPSWFVVALIWIRLLHYYLVRACGNGRSLAIVVFVLIMVNFALDIFGWNKAVRVFDVWQGLMALPIYTIGYLLKEHYDRIKKIYVRHKIGINIAMVVVFVAGGMINGSTSIQSCNFGRNALLMYAVGLAGSLLVIYLCSLIRKLNRWVYVLSCGMIVILCTHGFILNQTINKFPVFELYSLAWNAYSFVGCMALMVIEIPIILFFFRFLGWAVGGRRIELRNK